MAKIKVIHIILDMGIGGVEKFLLDLVLHTNKEEFETQIVCLFKRSGSDYEKKLDEAKIPCTYLDTSRRVFDFGSVAKINQILKREKPDVVNIHTYVMKTAAYGLIRNKDVKIVHTVHVPPEVEWKACSKRLTSYLYKKRGVTPVGVSSMVKKGLEEIYQLKDVPMIYNGIDLERFTNTHTRELVEPDKFRFINVSRFMPEKNQELVIRAFAKVHEKYTNTTLTLVGKGRLMDEMKALVKELSLEKEVAFLGARMDIPELLNQHDVFVLGSNYEGFGLVLAEAMSCGVPVISTDVGAVREVVVDGETGFLVEKGNVEMLKDVMIKLLVNKELRKRCSENGQKQANKFSLKKTVEQYETLYKNLARGE